MSATSLLLGVFISAIGLGYFIYGKRQQRMLALASGAGLMLLPYVVSSTWLTLLLAAVLMGLPFFID